MDINKWFKKQMSLISLAMAGVEKNAFGQNGNYLNAPVNQEQRHQQGTVCDDLIQGRLSVEVETLRWRMYKVLKASEGLIINITGYDENGQAIYKLKKIDKKKSLSKVKQDPYDEYVLEMVIDNSPIVTSCNDIMDNDNIILLDEAVINYNFKGEVTSATHGEISGEKYFSSTKGELPIRIIRDNLPKFEFETYVKKLYISKIDDSKRLLSFYVSQYPDESNRRSRLFISDVKKAIENPRTSSMLDIKEVKFITYKSLGVSDFLEFQYNILSFDKIVTHNGHYIIKFIAEVVINGKDILEEYRVVELDEKYNNKEKKKQ